VGESGSVTALESDDRAARLCRRHLCAAGLEGRVQFLGGGGADLQSALSTLVNMI